MRAYPKSEIIPWDWTGVNLQNESQHVFPKITDSIQYKVIQELKKQDFEIIYDDDYSGEIADVIVLKLEPEKISVKMYHLKYAHGGTVSNQIANFYEVCGQVDGFEHRTTRMNEIDVDIMLINNRLALKKNWTSSELSDLSSEVVPTLQDSNFFMADLLAAAGLEDCPY